jgi:hypothetical protein
VVEAVVAGVWLAGGRHVLEPLEPQQSSRQQPPIKPLARNRLARPNKGFFPIGIPFPVKL